MNITNNYVIETEGLSKSFNGVLALREVNLQVPRNSIFGFLGPNGAGKTTLMKILLGLTWPTSGTGKIFGYDIRKDSVAIRKRIGYLPQHPRFIEDMTARENLRFTADFFFSGPEAKIQERIDEMLELVGIADKADRPIKGFSGGEKQRLGIALAQINYPDLLILDEPASALDPLGRQAVLEIMSRLRRHTTIFYSTHILDDVQRVSDSVAILNRGQLVSSGPIEQILNGREGVVYNMAVAGNLEKLNERLKMLPWVTKTTFLQKNGTSLCQVNVSDEREAKQNLLRVVLSDEDVVVEEFKRKKFKLEEVFMDIVKGADDVN